MQSPVSADYPTSLSPYSRWRLLAGHDDGRLETVLAQDAHGFPPVDVRKPDIKARAPGLCPGGCIVLGDFQSRQATSYGYGFRLWRK